jgi:membrane-associated protein
MEFLSDIDQKLVGLFEEYGLWVYGVLFAIAFLESTVTPFLPGDALVFAVGAVAASGATTLPVMWVLFVSATVLGTMSSYELGRRVGPSAFRERRRFLNTEQLEHARRFFDRYGGRTLAVGRFVPVVRTLAPVVAGILRMPYARFMGYTVLGCVLWVTLMLVSGFFVDSVPVLRARFGIVLAAVFLLSMVPPTIEWLWDHIGRRIYRAVLRRFGPEA